MKQRLHELALFYVGKFATTRAKLIAYLNRKLRERGWESDTPADIERLVERLAGSGLVDDALYALSKSRSLTDRGYGGTACGNRFGQPASARKMERRAGTGGG